MFTGIVEESGKIEKIESSRKAVRLVVRSRVCGSGTRRGDSIAVNGCCLTVVSVSKRGREWRLGFDLLKETWSRTNLGASEIGSAVNLERSLRADGRMGGHFVTGHIDGTGTIKRWERRGADWLLDISAPATIFRHIIFKGAIAVDGISLTIAEVRKKAFRIWIIPHTYEVTALRERSVGGLVNLEADILGKYVEQFLRGRSKH